MVELITISGPVAFGAVRTCANMRNSLPGVRDLATSRRACPSSSMPSRMKLGARVVLTDTRTFPFPMVAPALPRRALWIGRALPPRRRNFYITGSETVIDARRFLL